MGDRFSAGGCSAGCRAGDEPISRIHSLRRHSGFHLERGCRRIGLSDHGRHGARGERSVLGAASHDAIRVGWRAADRRRRDLGAPILADERRMAFHRRELYGREQHHRARHGRSADEGRQPHRRHVQRRHGPFGAVPPRLRGERGRLVAVHVVVGPRFVRRSHRSAATTAVARTSPARRGPPRLQARTSPTRDSRPTRSSPADARSAQPF